MALSSILVPKKKARIGELEVDVVVTETHNQLSEVTDSAVENGSTVSDHVNIQPATLSMEGVISNRPTSLREFAQKQLSGKDAQQGYDDLRRLAELGSLVTVVTNIRVYDNMVMTSFSVDRDKSTKEVIRFRSEFKQINFAQNASIPGPTTQVNTAQATKNLGSKTKKIATAKQTARATKTAVTSGKSIKKIIVAGGNVIF